MPPFKESRLRKVGEKSIATPEWFKNDIEKFARPGTDEHGRFTRYAFRLCGGDKERAQDVMQNAIMQALKNHRQFKRGTNMVGWLSTIMTNDVKNEYNKQEVRKRLDRSAQTSLTGSTEHSFLSLEESAATTQRAERVSKMPVETQRAVLTVHRLGSFKLAAKELGLSIAHVRELLKKANDELSVMGGENTAAETGPRRREAIDDLFSEKDLEMYLPLLSVDQRNIYTAIVIDGKLYTEVAQELHLPEGTVKSRLSRARSKLAQLKGIEMDMSTHTERLHSWFINHPKAFEEAVKGLPIFLQEVANLLIVESKSPVEIASLLKLEVRTIRSYRQLIYESLLNK